MSDIVTLAKQLIQAEAVVTGEAYSARNVRIAEIEAELVNLRAAKDAEDAAFLDVYSKVVAVGDEEAFAEGAAAARAEIAAEKAVAEAVAQVVEIVAEASTEVAVVIE